MTVRVPASVKAELDQLRKRADAAGFDLTATLSEAVTRVARQMREELGQVTHRRGGSRPEQSERGRESAAAEANGS